MYRNSLRGQARQRITRQAHDAVIELHAKGVPSQHKHWHYDLRRGRLCIYGGLLRYIDACVAMGRGDLARKILHVLTWYVDDLLGENVAVMA